jgi:small-conductance mechanosensitive channel
MLTRHGASEGLVGRTRTGLRATTISAPQAGTVPPAGATALSCPAQPGLTREDFMTRRPMRIVRLVVPIALLVLLAPSAAARQAQGASGAGELQVERKIVTAPVVVDGVRLFRVQGVSAYPAKERAEAIAARIVDVATDPALGADSLHIEETELASQIKAGGRLVMNVLDADAAFEGAPRKLIASLYLSKITDSVGAYRAGRAHPALEWAAAWATALTLVFGALIFSVIWIGRKLDSLIESRYLQRVQELAARSRDVVSATRLETTLRGSLRAVRVIFCLALGFVYLEQVLDLFPHTRSVARSLAGYIFDPLATMGASFVEELPDLFFLAVLFLVVRVGLRVLRRFFDSVADGRIRLANFDPEWATPTYKLVRPLVIVFALVVGYPYIPGSSSDAFKGLSVFLGVMLSLGSSSFISNMIAGYTVIYRRAFRAGDVVQIGDVMGFVTAVRMLDTHVRTFKNENVAVPNSQLLNSHITNYSVLAKTSGVILHTVAGIGYETPWRQVEAMLLEAARRTPGLRADPPPFVLHLKLDDFCVQYELNAHCSEPLLILETYTGLHRNVLDVFNEYGVQIMTPAYMKDPDAPKVVPRDQWFLSPAQPDAPGGERAPKPRGAAFT